MGGPEQDAGAGGSFVPRQLPGATRHFVNRAVEQDTLTTLLAGVPSDGVVLLSTIDGTAGVGKSTFAVHWAHRMRGRFPDGELYVNLRGFDPVAEPMSPSEALEQFLVALGVSPERVPRGVDARAAMFRSVVHDRRMLVLLDNARDAEQVRPLLPAAASCLVLVTSRNQLNDLAVREGATRLGLQVLPGDEASDLLGMHLGKQRVADEPDAVDALVEHCAGLPLALGVVAVRAAEFVDFPLAELVAELGAERRRLDSLELGGETGIRAVFSWSYQSLSAEAARVFRLLGLPTGPDIGLDAIAALTGRTRRGVRTALAELVRANLLEQPERGRYRFHDLLRAYAAECAAADESVEERHAAVRRLLDFYLRTSAAAEHQTIGHIQYFHPERPESRIGGADFDTKEAALEWWEAERHNLAAATRQAAALGLHEHAWQLPRTQMYLFHLRGYTDIWLSSYETALASAKEMADQTAQGFLLHDLGLAHYDRQDYENAAHYGMLALPLFDEGGQVQGKIDALTSVGHARIDAGQLQDAVEPLKNALELAEQRNDPYHQGLAHGALALLASRFGKFEDAYEHFNSALIFDRESGEALAEGFVLNNLADAYFESGRTDDAIATYRQALDFRRQIHHRRGEGLSLWSLGGALREVGDEDGARENFLAATEVFEELGLVQAVAVRAELDELPHRDD